MTKSLYPGPVQRWGIGLGGGLEFYNNFDSLRRGHLKIFAYPRVSFSVNPFRWNSFDSEEFTDTGLFYLHSLKWVDVLFEDIIAGNEEAAKFAIEIVYDWTLENKRQSTSWANNEHIWGGHTVGLRTLTMVGLSEFFPNESWLHDEIKEHIASLKDHFDGYWNHGLVQSLALAGAASRLGDATGKKLGVERITKCFDVMIDDEGCINEQAPEYARYIERILRTTIKFFHQNEVENTQKLLEKKSLIREFIAHSLQPNGEFIELGDSHRRRPNLMLGTPIEYVFSNGTQGQEIPPFKIYSQGFVFGRSGFGQNRPRDLESYYTIRFGPARIIHGHNDHMSLTYWGKGRRVLVDPGHVGYSPGSDRNYVRQHESHNVLVSVGEKHDWSAPTEIVDSHYETHWQSYKFTDRGYPSSPRSRSVCFTDCGPFAVLDSATSETGIKQFSQRWNIAPEFRFSRAGDNQVEFTSYVDGTKFILLNLNIDSPSTYTATSPEIYHGDREKMRGLVAQGEGLVSAYNVGFSAKSQKMNMLTVGFLANSEEETGWSFRQLNDEATVVRIHIGSSSWAFNVNLTEEKVWSRVVEPPNSWGQSGLTVESNS